MPLISPANADTAILTNIRRTVEQIKLATDPNRSLVVDHVAPGEFGEDLLSLTPTEFSALTVGEFDTLPTADATLTVTFFADKEKTVTVFVDSNVSHPDRFIQKGTKTFYTPPDSLMNTGVGLDTHCYLPLYYVTAVFSDGITRNLVYRNLDNLLFQKVVVSTKKDPEFSTNDNTCVIVPGPEKLKNKKESGDTRGYLIATYDLYLQTDIMDRTNLTEEDMVRRAQALGNAIRLALYADRYRGGNAVLLDENIDGTYVGTVVVQPSKAYLRSKLTVQVARMVSPTSY